MAFLENLSYAVLQVVFTGAGQKDYVFSLLDKSDPRQVEYLSGNIINQPFNKICVHNLSLYQLVYTIEDDGYRILKDDVIILNQLGGNGMKTCPPGYFIVDDRSTIHRIRMDLAGPGKIELGLYR